MTGQRNSKRVEFPRKTFIGTIRRVQNVGPDFQKERALTSQGRHFQNKFRRMAFKAPKPLRM